MSAAAKPSPSVLIDLANAVRVADRAMKRRFPTERARLADATCRLMREANAGTLMPVAPSPDEAMANFKAAKRLAIEAGCNPVDLVHAFNGDEDRT